MTAAKKYDVSYEDAKKKKFDGSIWVNIQTGETTIEDAHNTIVRGQGKLFFIGYEGLEDDAEQGYFRWGFSNEGYETIRKEKGAGTFAKGRYELNTLEEFINV
jgi:hypothetical protein